VVSKIKGNKMKRFTTILLTGVTALAFTACGGGSDSSPHESTPQIPKEDMLYHLPQLTQTAFDNAINASSNTYEIVFEGTSYLKFKLTSASKFIYKNGGIEYSGKSDLLDANGDSIGFTNGEVIPAGNYTLKIHSDTNLAKYHPFITMISKSFSGTNIFSLPLDNGQKYKTPSGFKSFFKINIPNNTCIGISGSYQYVTLYNTNLDDTGYNLDNNIECGIPGGQYYLYYSNHTIYEKSFTISIEDM
jgi:hypothetical protein